MEHYCTFHDFDFVFCGFFQKDGYIEGQDDVSQEVVEDGYVIDFTIFVAQSQTSHQGRLIRLAESETFGVVTHQLLVDDWRIPEHVTESEAGFSGGFQTN